MTTDLTKDHQRWLDELVLELRLLDVGGRRIGDAVASAREFLTDAQLPAEQAFGTPREYARELGLSADVQDSGLGRTLGHAVADLLGFLAFAFAGGAAWRGERFELDAGSAVLVAVVVVVVLLTPRMLPIVLRAAPWRVAVGAAAFFAGQVALLLWLADVHLVDVPAWPVAAVGLALLCASLVRAWRTRGELADPVIEPLAADPGGASAAPSGRFVLLPHVVSFVAAWGFVALDVALAG